MITPSSEQQAIIDAIYSGQNVLVSAVAGSGKTTTVLSLAKKVAPKKILQITYNKLLKLEVRERVVKEGIDNVEIHTYHSLAVKYYDKKAYTDDVLQVIIKANRSPRQAIAPFDILVLDEVQDMTPILFYFISKFLAQYKKPVQIILLGDPRQAIYEFKEADSRFLTLGGKLWDSKPMLEFPLRISYRITNQIAAFVNHIMIGSEWMVAAKEGPPVHYIRGEPFNVQPVYMELKQLLRSKAYKPEDIFVLAPSIKNKSGNCTPVNKLENRLVADGIPCYVPTSDEGEINDDVIQGKVVFSTIHQSKGRERPVVVLFGFDNDWFTYYGRSKQRTQCPNELYVAVTRAKERLIVLESSQSIPLPFLRKTHEEFRSCPYMKFDGIAYKIPVLRTGGPAPSKDARTTPTDLLKYISEDALVTLHHIREAIFTLQSPVQTNTEIPGTAENCYGTSESVSDLNGTVIPMIWEANETGTCTIYKLVQHLKNTSPFICSQVKALPAEFHPEEFSTADFLHLATIWQAITTGYNSKLAQLSSYGWLTNSMVEDCHAILDQYLPKTTRYEMDIEVDNYYVKDFGKVTITGRLDAVTEDTVWELKCVKELQLEHFLQLILYAWMWHEIYQEAHGPRRFKLLNMRTGELWELDSSSYHIPEVAQILLYNKYKVRSSLTDTEFLTQCKKKELVLEDDIPITNAELVDVNLEIFTKANLEFICKARNIKGISAKNKDALIGMIRAHIAAPKP